MNSIRIRREEFGGIVRKVGSGFFVTSLVNDRNLPLGKRVTLYEEKNQESRFKPVVKEFKNISLSGPIGIGFQITNLCNLKCSYCYADAKRLKSTFDQKTLKLTKKICNVIAKTSILSCWVSGGEPTLVPDLTNYLKILTEAGIDVSLDTNGSRLTQLKCKELRSIKGLTLRISLDSINVPVNDMLRGHTIETLDGIKNALNNGLNFHVQTVVTRKNIEHLDSMYDQLLEWEVSCWNLLNLVSIGKARKNESLRTTDFSLVYRILSLNKNKERPISIGIVNGNNSQSVVMIDPTGKMYTNNVDSGEKYISGNIVHNSFNECWKKLPLDQTAHLKRFVCSD